MGITASSYVRQLAQMASGICGLDVNVILTQWQCEEGIQSTSQWPANNPAGITSGNSAVDALSTGQTNSAGFLIFATPAAGAQGYATLYKTDPNYAGVRAAIATGNPLAQLQAIQQSPWDAGHYVEGGYNHLTSVYNQLTGSNITITPETPSNSYPNAPSSSSSQNQISNQINFPPTNYSVVANSQHFGNILYGRRYRIVVSNSNGIGLDVSDLHCTFNIQKVINQQPPYCTIEIYNLNPETENFIINAGDRVTVEAGYEGSQYGLIFQGDIILPIRDKPDNVSYRLTLYALDSNRQMTTSIVNMTLNKGQSARSLVQNIASKATIPTPLGDISQQISTNQLPRGKAMFGLARDYFRQIAQMNNLAFYAEDGKINLIHASDPPSGEIFDLTPDSGLIGQPSQQDIGVQFQCLLNPSLKINSMVHIDNSLIQAQAYQVGSSTPPRNLDSKGIYRICGITHTGDTRGDSWYTSCTTVSQAGGIPGMISATTGSPW